MRRLKIMNAAVISILIWELPQPRASFDIVTCIRINPYIVYILVTTDMDEVNPF